MLEPRHQPSGLPGSNGQYTVYGRNLPGGQPAPEPEPQGDLILDGPAARRIKTRETLEAPEARPGRGDPRLERAGAEDADVVSPPEEDAREPERGKDVAASVPGHNQEAPHSRRQSLHSGRPEG